MRPVQRTPFRASGPRDRSMLQRAAVIASLKLAKTTCKTTCFTIWLKRILNTTKHLWRPVDNISQSLSPCCSSCATGLLQNKDQNNLAVKGFFPAPSGSGPTKTPLVQSLQFFLIEFNQNVFWEINGNYVNFFGSKFDPFFFPAFFCPSRSSGLITPTSPQHPSPVVLGLRSLFSASHRQQIGFANEGVVKKVFKKWRHAPPYNLHSRWFHIPTSQIDDIDG